MFAAQIHRQQLRNMWGRQQDDQYMPTQMTSVRRSAASESLAEANNNSNQSL